MIVRSECALMQAQRDVAVQSGWHVGTTQPMVWVLTGDRPGDNSQSIGLAEALGWPYDVKVLQPYRFVRHFARLPDRFLGLSRLGIRMGNPILPPWPDLVIATGKPLAPIARWIRKRSGGYTRAVQLGGWSALHPDYFDLVVSHAYSALPSHPRRMEITVPLNPVGPERLTLAARQWPNLFGATPRPHIALLVGGTSSSCRLDEETGRRLGEGVRTFAEAAGGTVHALTSRRTGQGPTEALKGSLGHSNLVHAWQPNWRDNPYLGYLAMADILVVTGDSKSMLAEAVASGKPVYIYPLADRFPEVWSIRKRFRAWVAARATAGSDDYRGTIRPPQWLGYLCARILSRGIVSAPDNIRAFHQSLFRLGIARPFGAELVTGRCPVLNEVERVARRVRVLLGVQDEEPIPATTRGVESVTTEGKGFLPSP